MMITITVTFISGIIAITIIIITINIYTITITLVFIVDRPIMRIIIKLLDRLIDRLLDDASGTELLESPNIFCMYSLPRNSTVKMACLFAFTSMIMIFMALSFVSFAI